MSIQSAPPALKLEAAPNIPHATDELPNAHANDPDPMITHHLKTGVSDEKEIEQGQAVISTQDAGLLDLVVPTILPSSANRPKDPPARLLSGKLKGKGAKSSIWPSFR